MLPVIAAEYKLVLVGDSSVGNPLLIKASPLFSADSSMESLMNNSFPPSVSTLSFAESKSPRNKSNYKSGIQQVSYRSFRSVNFSFDCQRLLQ